MSQLAAYCAVTGRQGFNDTSELHNIPFMVEVGPQKNNDQYTEVKGVYFLDGRDAASNPQSAPAAANQGAAPASPSFPQPSGQSFQATQTPPAGFAPGVSPFNPSAQGQSSQFQPGPVAGKAPWER